MDELDLKKYLRAAFGTASFDDEVTLSDEDKKRKQMSQSLTNAVYSQIIVELEGDDSDRDKIDRIYRERVCQLPTEHLDIILQTHEDGLFNRAPETISAIVSEITDRELIKK